MRCLRLADIAPGMILARPARALDGTALLEPGATLGTEQLRRLAERGLQELWVVKAGEAVPDPTVPEYLDRYGPDFAARLQAVFQGALVTRSMQKLFLSSLSHATDCYRRYRLDEREDP